MINNIIIIYYSSNLADKFDKTLFYNTLEGARDR